jgi:hypothetical protein
MTHMEAMAAIAQGVINIDAAHDKPPGPLSFNVIEKDSRIYRGMAKIVEEEKVTIDRLKFITKSLKRGDPRSINTAHAIINAMIRERTDPEYES